MSYLLQEDGTSKVTLEDGSGFLLLDTSVITGQSTLNLGSMICVDSLDLDDFICVDSDNKGSFIAVDSFNLDDFTVITDG